MALIPIYNSTGEAAAFLEYPYLYDSVGEWIGFVTRDRQVYSVLGAYVGYLTNEPRILRKRSTSDLKSIQDIPRRPPKASPPATTPLAPLMGELTHSTVDVLLEEPERLHTLDMGEFRRDLD